MKNDDWIKEAFGNAIKTNDEAEKIAAEISDFLEEHIVGILDDWASYVGGTKSVKFAQFLQSSKGMDKAIENLMHRFCAAGYIVAMISESKKSAGEYK